MSKNELQKLKEKWRSICEAYLQAFCERHEFTYYPDSWVASEPGTIAEVCDMFVSIDDVRYDVDNNCPEENFQKWYWKGLEIYELTGEKWMNYKAYCMGAPDIWTEQRLTHVRTLKQMVNSAQLALEDEIERIKKEGK